MQYFERAVFEKHPENAAPYDVLLSQLGTFQFKAKYSNGAPGSAQPSPTPQTVSGIAGQVFEVRNTSGTQRVRATVTDVKEAVEIQEPQPFNELQKAKGKFVIVFVTLDNIGTESAGLGYGGLRLKDSKGRSFDRGSVDATFGAMRLYHLVGPYDGIQPGLSAKSVLVYDVAPDATGYTIVVP